MTAGGRRAIQGRYRQRPDPAAKLDAIVGGPRPVRPEQEPEQEPEVAA